jgi:hypothetical protein
MPLFGFSTRMHFMRADLSADVSVLLCLCACSVGTGQGLTPVNGVSQVGVMDMLRFHRFTIGYAWCADYGCADKSEEEFKALYAISPLHNIKPPASGQYPAVLSLSLAPSAPRHLRHLSVPPCLLPSVRHDTLTSRATAASDHGGPR